MQAAVSGVRLTGLRCGNASSANATGIPWCRRVAERELHSRVRIETLAGCARASVLGCRSRQASPGSEEACSHGNGTRGRRPSVRVTRKSGSARERGGERQDRGGKAANLWKSRAGHSKGCCGAKVLGRRKASRVVFQLASFHAGGFEHGLGGFHRMGGPRERLHTVRVATGVSKVRFIESRVGTKNAQHDDA